MSINLAKSFKSPFHTQAECGLFKIYLIAVGFSLAIFIIHLIFGGLGIIICFVHFIHLIVVLSTQSFQFGYFIETIRLELTNKDSVMPAWEGNYTRYFINGFKIQIIALAYLLFNLVIITGALFSCGFIVTCALTMFYNTGGEASSYVVPTLLLICCFVIGVIPILLTVITVFLFPMICIRFAEGEKFFSAFNIIAIIKKVFKNFIDYSLATLIVILLLIPVLIGCIVLCLTVIGIVGIGLLQFIVTIIVLNMYAQAYKEYPSNLLIDN